MHKYRNFLSFWHFATSQSSEILVFKTLINSRVNSKMSAENRELFSFSQNVSRSSPVLPNSLSCALNWRHFSEEWRPTEDRGLKRAQHTESKIRSMRLCRASWLFYLFVVVLTIRTGSISVRSRSLVIKESDQTKLSLLRTRINRLIELVSCLPCARNNLTERSWLS